MSTFNLQMNAKAFFLCAVFFALNGANIGCGFRDLPKSQSEVQASLQNLVVQNRLRADIVPHLMKEAKSVGVQSEILARLEAAHARALSVDLRTDQIDERQMNRIASFQYALSSEIQSALSALETTKSSRVSEFRGQFERADQAVIEARQKYQSTSSDFNQKLTSLPTRFWNNWYYHFPSALKME